MQDLSKKQDASERFAGTVLCVSPVPKQSQLGDSACKQGRESWPSVARRSCSIRGGQNGNGHASRGLFHVDPSPDIR